MHQVTITKLFPDGTTKEVATGMAAIPEPGARIVVFTDNKFYWQSSPVEDVGDVVALDGVATLAVATVNSHYVLSWSEA